jgi:hypothetical protein
VKRQCFEKVNLGLPFFYNRCAVVLNYSTESKQTGHSRDRERDGSETESGGNAAQPHSEPPKGVPEAHEPIGVAVAATRFLPLRSDQSHRQRPRRPAPLPTVPSSPAFSPSECNELPLDHHAISTTFKIKSLFSFQSHILCAT